MKFINFVLAVLASLCLWSTCAQAGRIKRRSMLSYFIDYTEAGAGYPLPIQTSNVGGVLGASGVPGGYLESFVYTRQIYDSPLMSARNNIGSATYNVVLDYKDDTASGLTDICFRGTYSSIAEFETSDGGRVTATLGGTIEYLCPAGAPGTDDFVTYISNVGLPQAKSPVLAATNVVNLYPYGSTIATQKWNNVAIWDRQSPVTGNCVPDGIGGFNDGCATEYALDFRGPATQSRQPPTGFPGEGV